MKLHRYENERWPDYGLYEPHALWGEANVEVPEELFERYKKTNREYNAIQKEIANLKEFSND